jgi:hypothetical protein
MPDPTPVSVTVIIESVDGAQRRTFHAAMVEKIDWDDEEDWGDLFRPSWSIPPVPKVRRVKFELMVLRDESGKFYSVKKESGGA